MITDMFGFQHTEADYFAVTVCTTHSRFVPCRTDDNCVTSTESSDVERVRAHQQGE